MPEASIGLFPDVGANYFLSRLPGYFGNYQLDYMFFHICANIWVSQGFISRCVRIILITLTKSSCLIGFWRLIFKHILIFVYISLFLLISQTNSLKKNWAVTEAQVGYSCSSQALAWTFLFTRKLACFLRKGYSPGLQSYTIIRPYHQQNIITITCQVDFRTI